MGLFDCRWNINRRVPCPGTDDVASICHGVDRMRICFDFCVQVLFQQQMTESIKSVIRHVLSAAGGYLVAKGLVSTDQLPEIIGAIITIGSAIWGVLAKRNSSKSVVDSK